LNTKTAHRIVRIYLKAAAILTLAIFAMAAGQIAALGTVNLPKLVGLRPAGNTTAVETMIWVGALAAFVFGSLLATPRRRPGTARSGSGRKTS
jgi:hypothetical protein